MSYVFKHIFDLKLRINVRSCHKRHLSPVLIFTQPQKI
uniref:Uncharacterized protein n=1 Tax=Anguilla anguilla TaxID=7936 RepID=A0A0E9QM20_ANGAN